jgi:heme/copper-type cytochrome/quinol oxidase subunit 4
MKYVATFLLTILFPTLLSAQEEVAMADGMRSEGKIYVVVAIALVILLGLVTYLFLLDRKIGKVENQLKN